MAVGKTKSGNPLVDLSGTMDAYGVLTPDPDAAPTGQQAYDATPLVLVAGAATIAGLVWAAKSGRRRRP